MIDRLPDPVYEAAREVAALNVYNDDLEQAILRLRAALAAERVPDEIRPCGFKHGDYTLPDEDAERVPITGEMVERAWGAYSQPDDDEGEEAELAAMRAALDAALNGEK